MSGKPAHLCMTGRTILARTCPACGQFKQGHEFGSHTQRGVVRHASQCRACIRDRHHAHQDPSIETAENTRQLWSQDEDELALGDDPIDEVALVLGRTYNAVVNRRWLLRHRESADA